MGSSHDRLRAANAAGEERARLMTLRAQLVEQVTAADVEIRGLAQQLGKELADVERVSGGIAGQFRQAFGMPQVAKEQREAFDANTRYQHGLGERALLVQQIQNIDGRLMTLTPEAIAKEQQAARTERRAEIRAGGGMRAAAIGDLEISLESIDIELLPLVDAIGAGNTTLARLAELVQLLRTAEDDRGWRKRTDAAAGAAQRQLDVFTRTITELAPSGQLVSLVEPPAPLGDEWLKHALAGRDFRGQITAAIMHIAEREAFVRAELARIEERHTDVAQRRAVIAREYDELLVGE